MRSGDSIPGWGGDCCGVYAECHCLKCHHRANHPGSQSPETQKPARGGFSEEGVGRGGGIRTPNHRFWRPLFYQLELRPCIQRGALYKLTLKGKDLFLPFTRKCAINKRKVTKPPFCRCVSYFLASSINMLHGLLYNHSRSDSRMRKYDGADKRLPPRFRSHNPWPPPFTDQHSSHETAPYAGAFFCPYDRYLRELRRWPTLFSRSTSSPSPI